MAKGTIIKGGELMVFKNSNSLAFATSHTLTITAETVDVSCKDYGEYGATEVGKITWEIQSENLYTDDDYDTLFDAMTNKTKVELVWGHATGDPTQGLSTPESEYFTNDTSKTYYSGSAIITSLTANAPNGENATYSVTFTGNGKITKNAPAA